jgi:plasmid stability protein
MSTIVIDLPPETYKRLEEQARRLGQSPEVLSRALLEAALSSSEVTPSKTARAVLHKPQGAFVHSVRRCVASSYPVSRSMKCMLRSHRLPVQRSARLSRPDEARSRRRRAHGIYTESVILHLVFRPSRPAHAWMVCS